MSLLTDTIVYVENPNECIKRPLEISEISKITGYKVNTKTTTNNQLYFSILESKIYKVKI